MQKIVLLIIGCLFLGGLSAQNALSQAEQLTAKQAYEASSDALLDFIQQNPHRKYDVARAWWLIGQNRLALRDFAGAEAANHTSLQKRTILRAIDEIVYNYWLLSKIKLAQRDEIAALQAANQAMNMLIEDPLVYADLHLLAGRAYAHLGQTEDAASSFATAEEILSIELGPDHPEMGLVHFYWAELLHREKEYEEALLHYQQAYRTLESDRDKAIDLLQIWRLKSLLRGRQAGEEGE